MEACIKTRTEGCPAFLVAVADSDLPISSGRRCITTAEVSKVNGFPCSSGTEWSTIQNTSGAEAIVHRCVARSSEEAYLHCRERVAPKDHAPPPAAGSECNCQPAPGQVPGPTVSCCFSSLSEVNSSAESRALGNYHLQTGDSVVIPAGSEHDVGSEALQEMLEVPLPAELPVS